MPESPHPGVKHSPRKLARVVVPVPCKRDIHTLNASTNNGHGTTYCCDRAPLSLMTEPESKCPVVLVDFDVHSSDSHCNHT